MAASAAAAPPAWKPEAEVPGMSEYLDSLKWSKDGLVPVIAQASGVAGRRQQANRELS